jgi:hypothetical protein
MTQFQIRQVIQGPLDPDGRSAQIPYELEGDNLHVGGHSNHTLAVPTNSPDNSGYMGAMAILRAVVNRIVTPVEIPTANIINVAVSIIINSIHNLIGVDPDIGC